ncbi:MAG: FAD-dependent oxidoreductase, partial [Ectothiorhodospira sp.]
ERVITTDELFELETLPRSVGVLGLGAIGLEMGLALARLDVQVVGSDVARWPAGITDPELGQRVVEQFSGELPMWLGESARLTPEADGVVLESAQGREKVERILAAMGRRSNIDRLDPEGSVLPLAEDGLPPVDPATMQVGELPVFIVGDANGRRLLMHEAADEGSIAGYNAARGTSQRFQRRTPLAIAFTQPDIVSVGTPLSELDPERVVVGTAQGSGNGRSVILEAQDSMVRLYADAETGRLRGAALSAAGGEHLGHLLAWAIQRGETAQQMLSLPFYHPVVEEVVQEALQEIVGQLPDAGGLPAGLMPEG